MKISKRAQNADPSLTLSFTAKAKEMKRQGLDVVSFAAGEPDFDTLFNIKEAAKKAIDSGFSRYTETAGIMELREAICAKLRRDNWIDYDPKNILVTTGAKQAIFEIIMALVDPGDEVLIPVPYWVSYEEIVKIASGTRVFLKTKNFKIDAQDIKSAITPRTKLLILNSPNNPAGAVYSEKELKEIAKICVKNNIYVLSDEVYEKFVYNKKHISIASINDKIKKLTIVVNSVSKTYGMTGWRIGYCAGDEEIIAAATRLQDHISSNASSISQKAALAALTGPQDHIEKAIYEYKKRRDYMVSLLNSIQGIRAPSPDGASFIFADISSIYGKEMTCSIKFAEELLNQAYVAVIPGIAFGDDRCIRLSFTLGNDHIRRGIERLEKFVEKIR